jgi:hypothetical protein
MLGLIVLIKSRAAKRFPGCVWEKLVPLPPGETNNVDCAPPNILAARNTRTIAIRKNMTKSRKLIIESRVLSNQSNASF